ncbi:MAG: ion transporter [Saprospiraceae bacterium]|nr:ion transporter [Saprospiraceae bacterium]
MSFKRRVFILVNEKNVENHPVNRLINGFIMLLILLSVAAIITASFSGLPESVVRALWIFEVFVVIVFTIEYLLRIWIADMRYPDLTPGRARWKFVTSFVGIIDLIAILPFYLPFIVKIDLRVLRILRVMRLLRIFKLNRYSASLRLVGQIFREKSSELSVTILVTFMLMLLSSALMYDLEFEAQPDKFPNILSTLWWAVATLTTVGYGDVYPITAGGRILAGVIALLGIGLVALPAGILSGAFMAKLGSTQDEPSAKSYNYCPHCGEKL